MNIKKAVSEINIKLESITESSLKTNVSSMMDIIEAQSESIDELTKENQRLRDANNKLRGEQGKPEIRPQSKSDSEKGKKDFSSENDRKGKKNGGRKGKSKKNDRITITREEFCEFDKTKLPEDAIFKGHVPNIIQDLRILIDNVKFLREKYYSPSMKKTFIAPLPIGYQGEFGPQIKTLIIYLYNDCNMTEPKIESFLKDHDIIISASTISQILIKKHDAFHQEKKDIVEAGLLSSEYQQMDDTGARVNGKNYFAHILCNNLFTAYFTMKKKDRLTILEILSQDNLMIVFNKESYELMEKTKLSKKALMNLKNLNSKTSMDREEVDVLLKALFPDENKHKTSRRIILEAAGITYYQKLANSVSVLLVDDAPQYKQITEELALCWIHDGRHYKKLCPVLNINKERLDDFLQKYWDYYHKLLAYKKAPTVSAAKALSEEFDSLFSTKTGYEKLDERIEKTKLKKAPLLLVLKYPNIPLHNNASELGARAQARRRDISFQTINDDGTKAKDTFMTIIETAKKLGVNAFDYIFDRVSKKFEMISLAAIIKNRAEEAIVVVYDSS